MLRLGQQFIFGATMKYNKKLDETLSKYGGLSYDSFILIRNCAFGSRTEAFLDSDKDGKVPVNVFRSVMGNCNQ